VDFDIIIAGGQIVDGTGGKPYAGDVGIKADRIAAIGKLERSAARIIDAAGLAVSPGFIDMHSHSEISILVNPRAESKIRQGVTTELVNQCGISQFPLTPRSREAVKQATMGTYSLDVEWSWLTLDEYDERLQATGMALNHVPLVGHSTVRGGGMGYDKRPPTPDEMEAMKRLLRQGMEQGAFGFSTGLTLYPSMFADSDELVELCRVVAEYGGLYVTHARVFPEVQWEGIQEAVDIGRRAGLPVHVAHMGLHKPHWGRAAELIGILERGRQAGQDITYDVYPYIASSTYMSQLLPAWVQAGGVPAMVQRLGDRDLLRQIEQEMAVGPGPGRTWEWQNIMLAYAGPRGNRAWEGKSLADIAAMAGATPLSTMLMLIREQEDQATVVIFGRTEDDVKTFLRHPIGMFGSDGFAFAPYGPTGMGKPHPRSYGAYPRILGKYVREEKTMPLEQAVYKAAGFPAERLGLKDRGRVATGFVADLTIFDPQTVIDRATFVEPHQYPAGIPYVLVAGQLVIDGGEHTGALPGRLLRRGAQ
jgi:N-acyl-D-aspartate/D-glutamate deacylase